MKKNNMGFVLVETLIASTFIAAVMIYLFVQLKNVNRMYEKTLSYNNVNELYALNNFKIYLDNNTEFYGAVESAISSSHYFYISRGSSDRCSFSYGSNTYENDEYCNLLLSGHEIAEILVLREDSDLYDKNIVLNQSESDDLDSFIDTIDETNSINDIRLVAKFNNGNYADLLISDF